MAKYFELHPQNAQHRLVDQIVHILTEGGVMAYPTTSGYALGCALGNNNGIERIRKIRNIQEKQDFTLMCASISQASNFAKIDNNTFRLIKSLECEKYTFLLKTLPELSRRAQSKRGTVGIRIAKTPSIITILESLEKPVLSTSLLRPNEEGIKLGHQVHHGWSKGLDLLAFDNAWDVKEAIDNLVDLIIESGEVSNEPTTVLDLTDSEPILIRQGAGEW